MRIQFGRLLSLMAFVVVGLSVGGCLLALAEVASPTRYLCGPVNGEEISPSKAPSPSPWALPAESNSLSVGLPLSRCAPPLLIPKPVSAYLGADLSSRAPPTLL